MPTGGTPFVVGLEKGGIGVAETLVDRITMRLKRVSGVDRRLLMEAREALRGSSGVDAQAVWDWLQENDIKAMGWQKKRFAEHGVDVG